MKAFAIAAAGFILGTSVCCLGCTTTERLAPGSSRRVELVDDPKMQKRNTEKELVEATEKNPADMGAWANLGDYYEDMQQFEAASVAYERMNALIEKYQSEHHARFTGGHYMLGKIYFKLARFVLALPHLQEVVKIEPKDRKIAVLNYQFKETHFLL